MIIQCQNGRLLNANHVVQWEPPASVDEGEEKSYNIVAKTVLGTEVEVFRGESSECYFYFDNLSNTLIEDDKKLHQLSKDMAKRTDKLEMMTHRLIAKTG